MTNFDRAADIYDQTRGLAPAEMATFLQRLREALGASRTLLEIGVGTGRIAVPLAEGGLQVTGVDISERMLAVLRSKGSAVKVQVADATALPFPADHFDAGLAFHVFHLIPSWRTAVAELVRVVRPGGRIVVPWYLPGDNPLAEWQDALLEAADAREVQQPVGADGPASVREELERHGGQTTSTPPVRASRTTTLRDLIQGFEVGVWSRHWRIDDEVRAAAAAEVMAAARARGLDLDAPHTTQAEIELVTALW